MTKKQFLQYLISVSVLFISIFTIAGYIETSTGIPVNSTFFWWLIQFLVIVVFLIGNKEFFHKNNARNMKVIQWYLFWNFFCIFRGFFIAQTYWDFKGLIGNSFGLLIPIIAYSATNIKITQSILIYYLKYTLPLFLIFCFLIVKGAYGFYLVPIYFLVFFFPVLTLRWKWIILLLDLFVAFAFLGSRSNVIKFGIPVLIMLTYYFRFWLTTKRFELVRILLIVAPIFFFGLAVSGIFNIFQMDQYINQDYEVSDKDSKGEMVTESLTSDTRTFIYEEIFYSAKIFNSWWIGRSPARGNISESVGDSDENKRGERLGNELAIANIFTWTGVIGVILYFLVFYKASYLAINHSNNIFSKQLGLFIAFRWLYAWVEDINYLSLTTFVLWLTIGLCFSKSFRKMSNKEVMYWARGIFDYQYRLVFDGNKIKKRRDSSINNLS